MALKKKNIRALADFIESCGEASFSMEDVLLRGDRALGRGDKPECGTAACILGFYRLGVEHRPEIFKVEKYSDSDPDLNDYNTFLGTNEEAANLLFMPNNQHANWIASPGEPRYVTRPHAVAVLRHMADTGKIDWSVKP